MKRFLFTVLLALAACATQPLSTNDQIGKAIQEVTLSRQTATSLMVAKKITVTQDQQIQAELDVIRATLDSAQSKELTDPAQAAQLLSDALAALAKLQGGMK